MTPEDIEKAWAEIDRDRKEIAAMKAKLAESEAYFAAKEKEVAAAQRQLDEVEKIMEGMFCRKQRTWTVPIASGVIFNLEIVTNGKIRFKPEFFSGVMKGLLEALSHAGEMVESD